MNKNETELIYGDLRENIKDISILEAQIKVGNSTGTGQIKAGAALMKNSLPGSPKYEEGKSIMNLGKQTANAHNNAINHNLKQGDALSGEKLSEDSSLAIVNAKKMINNIETKQEKIRERDQKNIENLNKQKDTYKKIIQRTQDSKKAQEKTSQEQTTISEEIKTEPNEIQKKENYSKETQENVGKKVTSLKESSQKDFMDLLLGGTSGSALAFLLQSEINNKNFSEIEVAKKMQNDKEVISIIKKMRAILKKGERTDYSDADYLELKSLKLKFRTLFYR